MVDQFGIEDACKVAVEPFFVTDEFIAKTEAMHESALLGPEYGAERAREEKANTIICSANLALVGLHHLRAQLALH